MIKAFKVSSNIRLKLKTIAQLHKRAQSLMEEVEKYLKSKGFDVDRLRDGCGVSLEEFEYWNDITEEFCKWIESNCESLE
jgi:hypothetical protein